MKDYGKSPSLFDVPRSRWSDPSTSREAAASITPDKLNETQGRVLSVLRIHGPLTDEQLEDAYLSIWPDSASPQGIRSRRSELVRRGLVTRVGRLGETSYGRPCSIWRAAS